DQVPLEVQEQIMSGQLEVAQTLGLPVVLHVVGAHGLALDCLRRLGPFPAGGVLHAYSGSAQLVDAYAALGLSFAFGPAVCRVGARRREGALRRVPLSRLLLGTDAPDQGPPQGPGGTRLRNEPARLREVCSKVAALRGEE